jgi:oligoribonuclease NrnB/cAMP/cGMP phosphodiesterase (DHH superfamily)
MSDTSKPLVLYHSPCQDGFTAAWACWKVHPDWEFLPCRHGYLPEVDIVDREVYMLDISLKRDTMILWAGIAAHIQVIDHHISAQKELVDLPDNVSVLFDMKKSGAGLAWDFFHDSSKYPSGLVWFVQDKDLWRFSDPDTEAVCEYLYTLDYTFENWEDISILLDTVEGVKNITDSGNCLLEAKAKQAQDMFTHKFYIRMRNYKVYAINMPYIYTGEMSKHLTKNVPFVVSFWYDGTKTIFSLRSAPGGVDVSEIAKHYGGGGHRHASGFELLGLGFNTLLSHEPIIQI